MVHRQCNDLLVKQPKTGPDRWMLDQGDYKCGLCQRVVPYGIGSDWMQHESDSVTTLRLLPFAMWLAASVTNLCRLWDYSSMDFVFVIIVFGVLALSVLAVAFGMDDGCFVQGSYKKRLVSAIIAIACLLPPAGYLGDWRYAVNVTSGSPRRLGWTWTKPFIKDSQQARVSSFKKLDSSGEKT